jgi:hypothetical protein
MSLLYASLENILQPTEQVDICWFLKYYLHVTDFNAALVGALLEYYDQLH